MDNVTQLKGNTKKRGSKKEDKGYWLLSVHFARCEGENHIAYADRLLSDPELAKDLRFNLLLNRAELASDHKKLHPQLTEGTIEDKHLRVFWRLLNKKGAWVSRPASDNLVLSIANNNAYDPLVEQIKAVEGKWDGKPRINTWLSTYLKAEDNTYTRAVGRKFLLQLIARALAPLHRDTPSLLKCDAMMVLESPEGHHKSDSFKILVGHEFFSDGLTNINANDTPQTLIKNWVVELQELRAFENKSPEAIKDFITTHEQDYRFPWDKTVKRCLRRCVFVGTTNKTRYMTSTTGNRRYWPVRVHERVDKKGLERDREQLLAEACVAFRAGGEERQWWLTEEEEALANKERAKRLLRDPWEEELTEELETREVKEITNDEIKELVEDCGGRFNGTRVRAVCEAVGWKRGRWKEGKCTVRGYVRETD